MQDTVLFNRELIRRYDATGPRYTSYPTAMQFREDFGVAGYEACARRLANQDSVRPLSLYFHIPFCATLCFYCACNKVVTKNRSRAEAYMDRLYKEVAMQSELVRGDIHAVDQLHWGGGTPTFLSPGQMEGLMAETARYFRLRTDDSGDYSIELDPRDLDERTIPFLRSLGFNRVSIGVQDLDPNVQRAVNRVQDEALTAQTIIQCREEGIKSVNVDLIYGLPHQSVDSFERTLERISEMQPDRIAVYNYAHLPDRFSPQKRIRAEDLPSPEEKLRILQHVIERLTDQGYRYIGMDHFALPGDELAIAQDDGTLTRNFQGYTTHGDCDLIGMGITAIGKVGDCYAQNVKDLDAYYERIDGGRLPTLRGVRLDEDDHLRRDVITELMCHFRLDIPSIEDRHRISFHSYFETELAELTSMEEDGLVTLRDRAIVVEPAGRLLIRNICMVFDKYQRRSEQARFSKLI